jgi:hypothetical protein
MAVSAADRMIPSQKTLYEGLGGYEGIAAVINRFICIA